MPNFELDVRPLRAVLFDAVGTLLFADPPVVAVYAEVGRQCGSSLSRQEIAGQSQGRARRAGRTRPPRVRAAHGQSARRWIVRAAIVATVFSDVSDSHVALTLLWEHFARPASSHLAADAAELFEELEAAPIDLGAGLELRQPADCNLRRTAAARALPPQVCLVRTRLAKPSPNFFRAIEQRLDCPPYSLLLVGDDRVNDYLAARSALWQAVLIGAPMQMPMRGEQAACAI